MKKSVSVPFSREETYEILMDPIRLALWLDVPSVTTGRGKMHIFEIEDWRAETPWKVRGTIIRNVENEEFCVELDRGRWWNPVELIEITITGTQDGCILEADFTAPEGSPFVESLLDPKGPTRLQAAIAADTVGQFKETGT